MSDFPRYLDWIGAQDQAMRCLVADWSAINSGSRNLAGLNACADAIEPQFASLDAPIQRLPLNALPRLDDTGQFVPQLLGQALRLRKRPDAPIQIFLGIHYDTVYAEDHPFQSPIPIDANTLRGPGVADAKGGLVVLLTALRAFERTPYAPSLGWEVLLNPDEELGSPGAAPLFAQAARQNDLGLLFEPAYPDGALVNARKGSGNFTLMVTGRSAHVGRDPLSGRNAIHALADAIVALNSMNDPEHGIIASAGQITGGGPVNVVPDRALCRFNVRVTTPAQQRAVEQRLRRIIDEVNARDGIAATLDGTFHAPPKPLTEPAKHLIDAITDTGRALGLDLAWRSTGGVSDGNKLAAAGLPNIDTLGPRGGNLHSPDEYLLLDSLVERAKLTALLLMRLATGGIRWPRRRAT